MKLLIHSQKFHCWSFGMHKFIPYFPGYVIWLSMLRLRLTRVSKRGSRHCVLTVIYMAYWSRRCNGDGVELEDVSSSWISYITESLQSHPNPATVLCLKSYATQSVSPQGQYVACGRATDGPTGTVPANPGQTVWMVNLLSTTKTKKCNAINPASIMAMSRHAETSLSGNPILMMGASMETVSE